MRYLIAISIIITTSSSLILYADPILKELNVEDAQKLTQNNKHKLLIINFWATWCAPCVKEFPSFVKGRNKYKNQDVEVIFISHDFEDKQAEVKEFLKRYQVDWPSYIKVGYDEPYINSFSKDWSGALPATFLYNDKGELLHFVESEINEEDLFKTIEGYLDFLKKQK